MAKADSCLTQYIKKYDDGGSNTTGLAKAVMSSCMNEINIADEWRVYGAGEYYLQGFYANRMTGWENLTLQKIYEMRSKK